MRNSWPSARVPGVLALAWLASCSANVEGYRPAGQRDGSVGDSGAPSGGASPNGGGGAISRGGGAGDPSGGGRSAGGTPPNGGATSAGGSGAGGSGAGGSGAGGGGTGGSGQWPSAPRSVPLSQNLSGVTAAAFQPGTRRFFLLAPATRQYFTVDTTGSVGAPVGLPGSGTVASRAFGVSATDVFFVVGTTLYRQPVGGGAPVTIALPGNPLTAALSGAYAGGWFFLGNASAASQALADSKLALDPNAPNLARISVVTTDGKGFVFRALGAQNDSAIERVAPGTFVANPGPCSAGAFNTSGNLPLGTYGNTVAWVVRSPSSNPYTLQVASTSSGVCGTPLTAAFGSSGGGAQAVGLIDDTHALVTPVAVRGTATVDILSVGEPLTLTPLSLVNTGGAGFPISFVVGVEPVTHFAVLVTDDQPILVGF